MCALLSRFIKERNKVSNASASTGTRGMADSKDGWLWRGSA